MLEKDDIENVSAKLNNNVILQLNFKLKRPQKFNKKLGAYKFDLCTKHILKTHSDFSFFTYRFSKDLEISSTLK